MQMNMKYLQLLSVGFGVMLTSACTYQISKGIADDGTTAKEVIFPNMDDAWYDNGIFPNRENLQKVVKGVHKDDIYYLLGVPHYSEAKNAREWDYILKFVDEQNNSVKKCQYKIIFDKQYKAQSFYQRPTSCLQNLVKKEPEQPITIKQPTTNTVQKTTNIEIINLDADALFEFNQWQLSHVKNSGLTSLNELAKKLKDYHVTQKIKVEIIGYTDRLGTKSYNETLSYKRASTIRTHLINQGVPAADISVLAAADSNPKVSCYNESKRAELIKCLQPNRRVEIKVKTF